MSLMPREPFEAMMPLREAMNRLFEGSFIGPRFESFAGQTFPLDVYETPDQQQYVLEAALPGCKPEDIQITAEGDTVTLRVTRHGEEKTERGTYIRHERYEGEMSRSVTLPTTVDTQKADASYDQGVLTLRIPKAAEAKQKQIPVKAKGH
ncbi:MAG: Hsp20/alpha crystallin family protein [Ktedonobacteraceae bacterium]|nr:Hsp20/alpha crystallin family protein [Ktedonobacteraceae bacterium]MBO0795046.1 Hsp20/alpha crystallin family protein [Ktedonobacteraceae bacterium]